MPKAKTKSASAIGWTIAEIVRLFDFDRTTVGKILANTPYKDGPNNSKLYTGRQFLDAWLSYNSSGRKNVEVERARLLHHQANIAELDELVKRKELISVDEVRHMLGNAAMAIKRVITTSSLSRKEQDSVLAELKEMQAAKIGDE